MDLVYSSWLRGYGDNFFDRDGRPKHFPLTKPYYFRTQALLIGELLDRSTVLVFRSPVDESVARGFIVGEKRSDIGLTLHWVYTKSSRRREGVCRELVAALAERLGCGEGGGYTHLRNPGGRYLDAMGFRFSPQAIVEEKR